MRDWKYGSETVKRLKGKKQLFFSSAKTTTTTTIATADPTPPFQGLKESFSFSPFYLPNRRPMQSSFVKSEESINRPG